MDPHIKCDKLFNLPILSFFIQLVPTAEGTLTGNDDLYWKPASSSRLLYDQLSHRKFQEILRDDIRFVVCVCVCVCVSE